MRQVALTGASGFLGSHLVRIFASDPDVNLSLLYRDSGAIAEDVGQGNVVLGDIRDEHVVRQFVNPGSTVIHLIHNSSLAIDEQVAMATQFARRCVQARAHRLIYVSTASVVGGTDRPWVDEDTPCRPVNEYERTKLSIEHAIRDALGGQVDYAIVRPSAIFGSGGQNLIKLMNEIVSNRLVTRYLRQCIYGHRRMHLVPVETVAEAIRYLCLLDQDLDGNAFIVSDDEDESNNFVDVADRLARCVNRPMPIRTFCLPGSVLRLAQAIAGRATGHADSRFSSAKLRKWGFAGGVELRVALDSYARQFAQSTRSAV